MLRLLCLIALRFSVVASIDVDTDRHPAQELATHEKEGDQVDVVAVRVDEDGKVTQNEDGGMSPKISLMRSQDKYTAALVGEQDHQAEEQLPGPQTQYGYGRQVSSALLPTGNGPMPHPYQGGQQPFAPVGPPAPGGKEGAYGQAFGPAYIPSELEEQAVPAGFYLNTRPCHVPQWETGEVLCKEASKKARSRFAYVALDQLGQKQNMMRDGGVCTTQCSRESWWQRPVTANITCQKGYWVDPVGRDVDEMKCRTAPHIWALLTAIIGVLFVFVWVFVYYQPSKAAPLPDHQRHHHPSVLAPTLPPRLPNSVYVIRD